MRPPDEIRPTELGITRLLWIVAVLSIALFTLLAVVPVRAHFTEWRAAQARYNQRARAQHAPTVPIAIKQIWTPELEVTDRCGSCHLAAADAATPLTGRPLYAAHPPIPHSPRQFGCAVCHGGQGRATSKLAAHGQAAHWDEPLLARGYEQAGCGTCHSGLKIGPAKLVDKGRALVAELKCAGCHAAGNGAADLSTIGLHGFRADWHAKHVEKSATAQGGVWQKGFTPLADEEVGAVGDYLRTQIGAPRLMQAKAFAYRRGCRGCHRIDGVGGDDGPDLSNEGARRVAELDFTGVAGPHTLPSWLGEHFLNPPRVVPGSQMPQLGFTADEANLLTLFMLSLRTRAVPESLAPHDRVRALRLGERDFATDGESLFGVFCAACHGPRGEGRKFPTLASTFPAIGEPEFLAIADDEFLRKTLTHGRPGRRMPAWGTKDGGLRAEEIDALIGYLRSLQPIAPTADAVNAAPVDRPKGDALFARLCSPCHGTGGQGSAVAPPLAATDNPATREDSRIYGTLSVGVAGTAMGSFRHLDAASLRALIATVRALPPVEAKRTGWAPRTGDAHRGADGFAAWCSKCHGTRGEGAIGPALANAAFQASATDGYLTATILRGRGATAMPHFGTAAADHPQLSPDQVVDVIAFLRSLVPKS
ncbi:MAG: c-type cytochrome [Polyangia bacterium]